MKILVIGASARAAAQSIRRTGLEVAALDLFVDRDLAEIADCEAIRDFPSSILDQAKRWPDHAILLCGGMENFPEILTELELRHPLIGPNASQIRELRSLANWKQWAANPADGDWIRFPTTQELEPRTTGLSQLNHKDEHGLSGRDDATTWLYKSYRSAGGMKVSRYDELVRDRMSGGYFQQYVAGPVLGVTFGCTAREAKVLGVMQNLTMGETGLDELPVARATPFLYAGSIGPIELGSETVSRLENWIGTIASSIQYRGLLQADFVLGEDGLFYLLEFNPRWTSSMELIEMSTRYNLVDLQLRLQFSDLSTTPMVAWPTPWRDVQVQKRILYALQDLKISSETSDAMMNRSSEWASPKLDSSSLAGWADIPHTGTLIDAGSPLATIWAIRPRILDPIGTIQTSKVISPMEGWREIDELLETLDDYPACIHTVFTRH